MAKVIGKNRYVAILEDIFHTKYQAGLREFVFEREDMAKSAAKLKIKPPKNVGGLIYSFRYRQRCY